MAKNNAKKTSLHDLSPQGLKERLAVLAAEAPAADTQAELIQLTQMLVENCSRLEKENQVLQNELHSESYHRIFENSFGSNAILEKVVDPEISGTRWIIRDANQRLASFLGWTAKELPGMLLTDIIRQQKDLTKVLAMADQVITTGSPIEITGFLKDLGWNFFARLTPLGNNQVAFTGMDISPRLRLEEETRVLRTLAEHIPEGIAIADAEAGVIRMVSKYGCEQAGLPMENMMVNMPLQDIPKFWHVHDPVSLEPIPLERIPLMRSLLSGEIVENEELIMRVDGGRQINISVYSVPVKDEQGKVIGAIAAWRDITEQEGLLTSLAEEHRRLQAVLDYAPDGIVVTDAKGEVLFTNPVADRLRDRPVSTANGTKPVIDYVICFPDGAPYPQEEIPIRRTLRDDMVIINEEVLYVWPDGQKRSVMISAAPIRSPDGSISGGVAIFQDMKAIKEAEAALRRSEELYRLMGETLPYGVWYSNPDGKIEYASQSFLECIGMTLQETQNDGWIQSLIPEDRQMAAENWMNAIQTGKMVDQEVRLLCKDGNIIHVLTRGLPLKDADGRIAGWAGINLDMSGWNALEAEAAQRGSQVELQHHLMYQRDRERLRIAQDLHDGPIQELYGMVYTLKALEDEMSGRQALGHLVDVEKSLQSLAGSLRQFCNELRPPSLGTFGLESAIRSHVDNVKSRFQTMAIKLDLDEEKMRLRPEVRLGFFRVFQELLSNAYRHSQASQVRVTLRVEDDQVWLEVKDNGRGFTVPTNWIEIAREGHLGLVGIQERVDAVGGKLQIESKAGEGSTVRVIVEHPYELAITEKA